MLAIARHANDPLVGRSLQRANVARNRDMINSQSAKHGWLSRPLTGKTVGFWYDILPRCAYTYINAAESQSVMGPVNIFSILFFFLLLRPQIRATDTRFYLVTLAKRTVWQW